MPKAQCCIVLSVPNCIQNQQHIIKIIGFNSSELTYHNIKNGNLPTCCCPPLWRKVNYDYWSHYIE